MGWRTFSWHGRCCMLPAMLTNRPRVLSLLFGLVLMAAAGTGCGDVTALSIDSGSGGSSGDAGPGDLGSGGSGSGGVGGGGGNGSGGAGGSGPVPVHHRPTAVACAMDRPAGVCTLPAMGIGACTADSECAAGQNGRCLQQGRVAACSCSYDTCFADTDCAAGAVCSCGGPPGLTGRSANVCLKSSCRVDADCGGRYCSPTVDFGCGAFIGVVGYYCHTAKDTCLDDADCASQGGGDCRYNPTTADWTCVKSICAG